LDNLIKLLHVLCFNPVSIIIAIGVVIAVLNPRIEINHKDKDDKE